MSVCPLYIGGIKLDIIISEWNFQMKTIKFTLVLQQEDNLQNQEGGTEFSFWISSRQIGEAQKNCPDKTKIYCNQ